MTELKIESVGHIYRIQGNESLQFLLDMTKRVGEKEGWVTPQTCITKSYVVLSDAGKNPDVLGRISQEDDSSKNPTFLVSVLDDRFNDLICDILKSQAQEWP